MSEAGFTRRNWLRGMLGGLGTVLAGAGCRTMHGRTLQVATFSADVTVPPGHGMMGGAWLSQSVADPLEAHGFVLRGAGQDPVVFVSVDWCEIRNDAYARWQTVLGQAAGTLPHRVMISTVHQHDAPVADLEAERILRTQGLTGTVCDPLVHEVAVQRVAAALREAMARPRPVTHLGTGQAKVERIASNRRYVTPDGRIHFDRTSSTQQAAAREAEEGVIDPWLKTLSLWHGDEALVALNFYAVHPMSYYGRGEVSADFPGLARRARQTALPRVPQIYVSGCSGNVTAGKYNDGSPENRPVLAGRLEQAMAAAWRQSRRMPVRGFTFRMQPLILKPRTADGFDPRSLESRLAEDTPPFQQCLAAMGLSWHRRIAQGRPIEIPCLDFGPALLLLLPGESYVEFQLASQQMRPDAFVCVAGYGDGATGYIPTEQHVAEGDSNLGDWCWVAPGADRLLLAAIQKVTLPTPEP